MARYQTFTKSSDVVKIFPTLVRNYNNTVNKTTRFRPSEVNEENSPEVFNNTFGRFIGKLPKKSDLKVGDFVRVSRLKLRFAKSSEVRIKCVIN